MEAIFDSLWKMMTAVEDHTAVGATTLGPKTACGAMNQSPIKLTLCIPIAWSCPTDAEVITTITYPKATEANPLLDLSCRLS
jgi:hypothetical protein